MDVSARLLLFVYLISDIWIFLSTISKGHLVGNLSFISTDNFTVITVLFVQLVVYAFLWLFYKRTEKRMPRIKGFPKYDFIFPRAHVIVLVLLLIKIYANIFLKIGIVGVTPRTNMTFLFNMITIENFFPIYYVIARKESNKIYWVNVILWIVLNFLDAYTGFLIVVVFVEIHFAYKKYKNFKRFLDLIPKSIIAIFSIFAGSFIYKFVYPLKFSIRLGVPYSSINFPFDQAVDKMVSRFSNLTSQIICTINLDKIVDLYRNSGVAFTEIKAMFRQILPSFIMQNKDFRALPNLEVQSVYANIEKGTGSDLGILVYWRTLSHCDFAEFLLYLVLFIFCFLIITSIFQAFNNEDNDLSIIYFIFLLRVSYNATLEQAFSSTYLNAVYVIFIMLAFGGIRRRSKYQLEPVS